MHSHSLDLRKRIVQSYLAGEGSIREIGKRFLVSPTTVYEYLKLYRQKGYFFPKEYVGGRKSAISDKQLSLVKALLQKQSDMTLTELCTAFEKKTRIKISSTSMWRAVKRIGWTHKKRLYVLKSKIEKMSKQNGKHFCYCRKHLIQGDSYLLMRQVSI